ncbi:MAG: hypothetical protein HUU33_00005 [Flavobacteriales bacterium]|nr:hypothetical protein [Flavobacteriales bacterium]
MVRSRAGSRVVLLTVVALLLAVTGGSAAGQTAKGPFAFHYASTLSDAELQWLSRFEVVVPGDILPAAQVSALRAAGAKLFFYEWATGLYIDDPTRLAPGSWEATVWANRARWLLNPDAPDAGPDGRWRTYYYDPAPADLRAARIDRHNPQRVLRALEVCLVTGRPFSAQHHAPRDRTDLRIVRLAIGLPRPHLYARIDHRVDAMMDAGLLEEARGLLPHRHRNALNTVGYKELFRHFDGALTLAQAVDLIKQHTRNYAKRQLTWLRREPAWRFLHGEGPPPLLEQALHALG